MIPYSMSKDTVTVVMSTLNKVPEIAEIALKEYISCPAVKKIHIFDNTLGEFKPVPSCKIHLEASQNMYCVPAVNKGTKDADTKYIALVGDDVICHPTTIGACVSVMERDPSIGILTALTTHMNELYDYDGSRSYSDEVALRYYDNETVPGHFMFMRKDEIPHVTEELKIYFADTYFIHTMRKRGMKIADITNFPIWHRARSTLRTEPERSGNIMQRERDIYYNWLMEQE